MPLITMTRACLYESRYSTPACATWTTFMIEPWHGHSFEVSEENTATYSHAIASMYGYGHDGGVLATKPYVGEKTKAVYIRARARVASDRPGVRPAAEEPAVPEAGGGRHDDRLARRTWRVASLWRPPLHAPPHPRLAASALHRPRRGGRRRGHRQVQGEGPRPRRSLRERGRLRRVSHVGKGGIGIGGARGKGWVYERRARSSAARRMTQVTIGFQFGGQVYSEVVFFKTQAGAGQLQARPPQARRAGLGHRAHGPRVGGPRLPERRRHRDDGEGRAHVRGVGGRAEVLLHAAREVGPSVADLRTALQAALADRYRLERELGRGGMATVYLAQDLRHDRPVALKVLHPELAASLGPERFQREIRMAARLQHPAHPLDPRLGRGARRRLDAAGPLVRDAVRRGRVAARPAGARAAAAAGGRRSGSGARRRTRWSTPTGTASSTATSSRRTSCSPGTTRWWRTSASPGRSPARRRASSPRRAPRSARRPT